MSGNNDLMLDVGTANEMKMALRRAGFTDAEVKEMTKGDFLRGPLKVLRGLAKIVDIEKVAPKILKLIGTLTLSATTRKFVARDKFIMNTDNGARVKISYLSDNFTNWFLDKKEDPVQEETVLRYHELLNASVDDPIIAELGGKEKVVTTLASVYATMQLQRNGKKGTLLTNNYANIFYVRDITGTLRAVCVGWYGGGWSVYANEVSNPNRWNAGNQVFTRNSLFSLASADWRIRREFLLQAFSPSAEHSADLFKIF